MAVQRRVVVIAYTDGRVDRLPLTPKIQVYFERTYKIGIDQLNGAQTATNLYKLAWEVARGHANGAVMPGIEAWLDTVEVVEVDLEDIVPLDTTASGGPSPASASPAE